MNQHTNTFTNVSNIGLALAVWLAHDTYDNGADQHPGQNLISATSILKPTRQIVLAPRVPAEARQPDISERIAAQLGRAIHESIEIAWRVNHRPSLLALGYGRCALRCAARSPPGADAREHQPATGTAG